MGDYQFTRYMALQDSRVVNHGKFLEKKHGTEIPKDVAWEHWATFNEAYFATEWCQLYAEHKHEFRILCDRHCGRYNCKGIGKCELSDELVHHIEYGLEKIIDLEKRE